MITQPTASQLAGNGVRVNCQAASTGSDVHLLEWDLWTTSLIRVPTVARIKKHAIPSERMICSRGVIE
jgi:hypothetical protein